MHQDPSKPPTPDAVLPELQGFQDALQEHAMQLDLVKKRLAPVPAALLAKSKENDVQRKDALEDYYGSASESDCLSPGARSDASRRRRRTPKTPSNTAHIGTDAMTTEHSVLHTILEQNASMQKSMIDAISSLSAYKTTVQAQQNQQTQQQLQQQQLQQQQQQLQQQQHQLDNAQPRSPLPMSPRQSLPTSPRQLSPLHMRPSPKETPRSPFTREREKKSSREDIASPFDRSESLSSPSTTATTTTTERRVADDEDTTSTPPAFSLAARRLRAVFFAVAFPFFLKHNKSTLSRHRHRFLHSSTAAYETQLAALEASFKKSAYIPLFSFYKHSKESLDYLKKDAEPKRGFFDRGGESGDFMSSNRLVKFRARVQAMLSSLQWFVLNDASLSGAQSDDTKRKVRHLHFLQSMTHANGAFFPNDPTFLSDFESERLSTNEHNLRELSDNERKCLLIILFLVKTFTLRVLLKRQDSNVKMHPVLLRNLTLTASMLVYIAHEAVQELGWDGFYTSVQSGEGDLKLFSYPDICSYAMALQSHLPQWKATVLKWVDTIAYQCDYRREVGTVEDRAGAAQSTASMLSALHPAYMMFNYSIFVECGQVIQKAKEAAVSAIDACCPEYCLPRGKGETYVFGQHLAAVMGGAPPQEKRRSSAKRASLAGSMRPSMRNTSVVQGRRRSMV